LPHAGLNHFARSRIQFGGRVKNHTAGRIGVEYAIDDNTVEVKMGIE
jgi:hypothetical protein